MYKESQMANASHHQSAPAELSGDAAPPSMPDRRQAQCARTALQANANPSRRHATTWAGGTCQHGECRGWQPSSLASYTYGKETRCDVFTTPAACVLAVLSATASARETHVPKLRGTSRMHWSCPCGMSYDSD